MAVLTRLESEYEEMRGYWQNARGLALRAEQERDHYKEALEIIAEANPIKCGGRSYMFDLGDAIELAGKALANEDKGE